MRKTILATLLVLLVGCWSMAMADSIAIGNGASGSNANGLLGQEPNLARISHPSLAGEGR